MIPKIEFVYSFPYDMKHKNIPIMERYLKERGLTYPTYEEIMRFIKRVENAWKKESNEVLQEIQKITKFKWQEQKIKVYIIGIGRGISDPLTLPVEKNTKDFIDTLTHELIHNIQFQNTQKFLKWMKYARKKYHSNHPICIRHIFLHALHYELTLKLHGKRRANELVKKGSIQNYKGKQKSQELSHYAKSWEIVMEETPQAIIKKFHEVTK